MIFLVVKESMQGTAYGIMVSLYNAGLILLPLIISYILEQTEDDEYFGYFWVGIFFIAQSGFSFLCLLVIMYVDRTSFGNSLSQPSPDYDTNESIQSVLINKHENDRSQITHEMGMSALKEDSHEFKNNDDE